MVSEDTRSIRARENFELRTADFEFSRNERHLRTGSGSDWVHRGSNRNGSLEFDPVATLPVLIRTQFGIEREQL
jgi:hypothetical protein